MSMNSAKEQEDLRVRRTRKLLWDALMALLVERDFEKISVKDICEQAMVHRTTFYKHYEDKHDLLLRGMKEMHDSLAGETGLPKATSLDESLPQYFVRVFVHISRNQHVYRLLLCGTGTSSFQTLMRTYLAEGCEARLRRSQRQEGLHFSVPLPILAQFYAGALIGITTWWLENDLPLTPQEMAHALMLLLADGYHAAIDTPPGERKREKSAIAFSRAANPGGTGD